MTKMPAPVSAGRFDGVAVSTWVAAPLPSASSNRLPMSAAYSTQALPSLAVPLVLARKEG